MSETVQLRFKYSEQEYTAAVRAYMLHTPEVLIRVGVFLSLLSFGIFMFFVSAMGVPASLLWAAATFLAVGAALFFGAPKRRFRAEPKFRDEYFLEFSDEGIHLHTANIDSKVNWGLYTRFLEDENYYLLVYGKYMMSVIPKRAFTDARQEARFRELLRRNLTPRLKAKGPDAAATNELEGGYVPPPEPPDWR